ncbi:MAG: DUF2953 domain-containing protein [Clostridia bacterium]|nr:DUF2953 domain-containing protein [Clostridia bacterium]
MWVVYSLLALLGLILLLLLVPVYGRVSYNGEELRVRIRVLGIPVTLLPAPAEDAPQKPPKERKKKKPGSADKPSKLQEFKELLRQDDLAATLGFLKELAVLAGKTAAKALKAVTVDRLTLQLLLATGDPAETATLYGKVCGVLYPTLAVVEQTVRVRRRYLRVEPNFLLEKSAVRFDLRLHVSVLKLLGAGLYLLVKFLALKEENTDRAYKEDI